MQRQMLKSKIHRATVTDCDVDYIGSITIDTELMASADLITNEQVHVWDIDNGARFVTYVIDGEPGSGTMQVNGAAAHLTRARPQDHRRLLRRLRRERPGAPTRPSSSTSTTPTAPSPSTATRRCSSHELGSRGPTCSAARRAPAGDPAAAGRDEGGRRTDRDGHRLRLPLGEGRRGGRRRHRPGRRHGGDGRPRLPGHRAGLDGRDGHPRQSGAPRPESAADGRRHADGELRGEQRDWRSQRPAAGQGDRLPGRQARGRAASRSSAPGRSSAPASR